MRRLTLSDLDLRVAKATVDHVSRYLRRRYPDAALAVERDSVMLETTWMLVGPTPMWPEDPCASPSIN